MIVLTQDEPGEWVSGEMFKLQEDGGEGEGYEEEGGEVGQVRGWIHSSFLISEYTWQLGERQNCQKSCTQTFERSTEER